MVELHTEEASEEAEKTEVALHILQSVPDLHSNQQRVQGSPPLALTLAQAVCQVKQAY